MWDIFFKGAIFSGSLIMAIGGQNAFVLKQGLLKQHVFWIALICFVCDVILMSIGVMGLGAVIAQNQTLSAILALFGGVFLFGYGLRAFQAAFAKQHAILDPNQAQNVSGSLKKTILTTFAVTLLNPHVYLDTVVLVGSLAASLQNHERVFFLLGAISVSGVWFFGLAYGARLLQPLFAKPRAWQILEGLIGCLMWWLSAGLLLFCYRILFN